MRVVVISRDVTIRFGSLSYRPTEGNGIRPLKLFCRFLSSAAKKKITHSPESGMPSSRDDRFGEWKSGESKRIRREFSLPRLSSSKLKGSIEQFLREGIRNITRNKFPSLDSVFFLFFFPSSPRRWEIRSAAGESSDDFTCNSLDNNPESLFDGYVEQRKRHFAQRGRL